MNQNRRTIQNYRYIESANNILKLQFRLVLSRQYVFYNLNLEITKAINGCQHRIFWELIWVKQKSLATLESWLYLYSKKVWSLQSFIDILFWALLSTSHYIYKAILDVYFTYYVVGQIYRLKMTACCFKIKSLKLIDLLFMNDYSRNRSH